MWRRVYSLCPNDHIHHNLFDVEKKKDDNTVMSEVLRKVSGVVESLGITEQYFTISSVQPRDNH